MEARIRFGQRIGRGGMAEVFAAKLVGPAGFEKDVAVKRLLPRFASDPVFLERFLNEARLAARLSHPNIVQIFELGHDGNDHYIVMEAVRGASLRGLLARLHERRVKMPVPIAAAIGGALCAGLGHAHEQHRVIHRDVSPHNVLLSFDGAVKLIDFGIARARSDERLTQVGQIVGKRRYMSPEQTAGEALDERSDIFAAGIILYEMLAGEHPFDDGALDEAGLDVSDRIQRGKRPRLRDVARDVAPALCDVVERALATAREQRFASARDMGRALVAASPQASAGDLEDLLRRLFAADTDKPWPVEDVRRDGGDHTATGDVAGGQTPLHEITISSDIDEVAAVTDPSAPRPALHVPIGADELPDVTQPDGPRPQTRRALLFAGLGTAALAVLGIGAIVLLRTRTTDTVDAGATASDAGAQASDAREDAREDAGASTSTSEDAGARAGEDAGEGTGNDSGEGTGDDSGDSGDDPGDDSGDDSGGADAGALAVGGDDLDKPVVASDRVRPRTARKRGKLTVETRPWTHVRVDGKRVGTTPLAIDVTVGRHRLTLENDDTGIRRDVDITVTAEEPTVIRLDLRK